jgi:hypothetical protein
VVLTVFHDVEGDDPHGLEVVGSAKLDTARVGVLAPPSTLKTTRVFLRA